jgi:hypothetical protein
MSRSIGGNISVTVVARRTVATADLSVAGVAGTENIGGPGNDVALGTVNLMNDGADDMTVEFRINAIAAGDPILGLGATSLIFSAKAVEAVHPIHKAQLLSYMKLLDVPLGLLINFNELKVTDGISRMMLPKANIDVD